MSNRAWGWKAQCLTSTWYHVPFSLLMGLSLLSAGCAAQPDLLKLQQAVKYEKKQTAQREESLQKNTDEIRENLQRGQVQLRAQLDEQHKKFIDSHTALAEEMRQLVKGTNAAFHTELSDVRVLAARFRGDLANVREVELGGVIGRTEENQKEVEFLRLQLNTLSDELHGVNAKLEQLFDEQSDHAMMIETLQSSLSKINAELVGQSKTLGDFGEVLGKRIEELEKHREWLEMRTAGLIEKQAADVAAGTMSLNKQRDSLAGFEAMLGQLGEDLAVQVSAQGSQQDARIQAMSAQVQRMQGWVETRTQELAEQQAEDVAASVTQSDQLRESLAGFEGAFGQLGDRLAAQVSAQGSQQDERLQTVSAQVQQMQSWVEIRTQKLAEQDATDMAMTALRVDELRKSLASFEIALSNIGEQLSVQLVEQGSRQDDRVQALSGQVQRMQQWVETRTQVIEKKQTTDGIVTAAQLEKLRGSLAGFEDAIMRLGEGVAVQMTEQEAQRKSLSAQLQATQSELTHLIDQLTARVEQGATRGQANE